MRNIILFIFTLITCQSFLHSQNVVEQITDFGGVKDGVNQYSLNIVQSSNVLFFPSFSNVNGIYPSKPYLTKYNLDTKKFELVLFNNKPVREPHPMFQLSNGNTIVWAKVGDFGSVSNVYKLNQQGTSLSLINDQIPNTPLCGEVIDDKLFFNATTSLPDQLWVSDGTPSGTFVLKDKDLNPIKFPCNFTKLGNNIIFSGNTNFGQELYVTDGIKSENTKLIKDINPSTTSNGVTGNFKIYDSKVFFTANNQVNGEEAWYTDGTSDNTKLLKDINPGAANSFPRIIPTQESLILLAENINLGVQIWESDGTTSGTNVVSSFTGNQNNFKTYWVEELDSMVLLASNLDVGYELYKYNKVSKTLELVFDIYPGIENGISSPFFIKHKGVIYFVGNDPIYGFELWRTDGTKKGTYMIKDIDPSKGSFSSIELLKVINDKLYFSHTTANLGRELYSYDTTQDISSVIDKDIQYPNHLLFPNPTDGTIFCKCLEGISFANIYTSSGLKYRVPVNNGSMDLSEFYAGLYYILIESQHNVSSIKVLKK